ncbi:hypothetical protein FHL15_001817 [Xylaria flabelliformis]|uniref:Uncharacterized protein n=1 Tax=Xylaria flabelliformis TaxID=2512241 RepID=A0A553IBH0_9PEZI|nr:hypothetical protein FHL15_001817 [Xylaria flabelliformis]
MQTQLQPRGGEAQKAQKAQKAYLEGRRATLTDVVQGRACRIWDLKSKIQGNWANGAPAKCQEVEAICQAVFLWLLDRRQGPATLPTNGWVGRTSAGLDLVFDLVDDDDDNDGVQCWWFRFRVAPQTNAMRYANVIRCDPVLCYVMLCCVVLCYATMPYHATLSTTLGYGEQEGIVMRLGVCTAEAVQ